MADSGASMIPMPEVQEAGLARYQPANLKQLVWFAGEVAKSGMYLKTDGAGNQVPMTQAETFMVMSEGIEMGISPLTAMRNIYFMEDKRGRKTTIPRADLIAARIQADPRTEEWDVDDTVVGTVTVSAKRRGRTRVDLTLTLADIPSRDKERWAKGYLDPQEMLVNRTVRRLARRHFKDMVLGLGVDQEYDETKVIDVAKVEREVGADLPPCAACGARQRLIPSRNGGMFTACDNGHTSSPPQEVRDLVRGTPETLTLAGPASPTLEEGEREPEPGELAADNIDADGAQPEVTPTEPTPPQEIDEAGAPHGPTVPAGETRDPAFEVAAGIVDRAEAEQYIDRLKAHLATLRRDPQRKDGALTILRAHGYDDGPLTSWLVAHPEELPSLMAALEAPEA